LPGTPQFELLSRLDDARIGQLCRLYQNEWWSRGRSLNQTRRLIEHSDLVVAFAERSSSDLVAIARVLTDFTFKALIFDVIVAQAHRGVGLGGRLIDAIVHHPALADVQDLELYCRPEMVPFYEKRGFTAKLDQLHFMRRKQRRHR
jgi:GNAT superfamily N-acetyltransferase